MKYVFILAHQPNFPIRAMCRICRVHPSGFYAWLKKPFSARTQEDKRQAQIIEKAWHESGKVYGYRKLHNGLREQGETCCPKPRGTTFARLARIKPRSVINAAQAPMEASRLWL